MSELMQLVEPEVAARILRVKPNTLNVWRHLDKGPPYVRVGRSIRYRVTDLDKWVESRTYTPAVLVKDHP